jgi:hypothetical protein
VVVVVVVVVIVVVTAQYTLLTLALDGSKVHTSSALVLVATPCKKVVHSFVLQTEKNFYTYQKSTCIKFVPLSSSLHYDSFLYLKM